MFFYLMSLSNNTRKPTLFLSYDVETNGPAPGLNSMLSFGIYGFDEAGKTVLEYEAILKPLPDAATNPDTMKFWASQPEAWAYSTNPEKQRDPKEVFLELTSKFKDLKKTYQLCSVAHPVAFDWSFLNYYFWRFANENPLGYQSFCITSYSWALTKHPDPGCGKCQDYYASRDPADQHDHTPLSDARGQGKKFYNMWRENTHYLKELFDNQKIFLPKC